jgi:MFS family permease
VGALTLGWPMSASLSGKVYLRIGFRFTVLIGSALATLGAASTLLIDEDSTLIQVAASCFVIGTGIGLVAAPSLIAAQSSAEWTERGVVTSSDMFARSIGSAVGVAVFGAIVNSHIGTTDHPAQATLSSAVHLVFVASVVMALVMVVASAMMPGRGANAA